MSKLCLMTLPNRSNAKKAQNALLREQYYCLPIDETDDGRYFFGFVMKDSQLTGALLRTLNTFHATDIEVHPLNERRDYENYCHVLYYNDYEAMEEALECIICGYIDEHAMVFDVPESSAYTWRVVFCTRDEIGQEQKDLIMAAGVPVSVTWNDPVTGNTSPTSIFKSEENQE